MQNRKIYGNLVVENEDYIVKGNLSIIGGTITLINANLVVEGSLKVLPEHFSLSNNVELYTPVLVQNGGIYAKDLSVLEDIVITNGNICTFFDLDCYDIYSTGDINVGRNSNVGSVFCRNYLVDGCSDTFLIEAEKSVYIMEYSNNFGITAPEVFLGDGGDFNGCDITAKHFEFGGHVTNCFYRHFMK